MRLKSGMELKIHPAAELFPLMADDELAELAADIKKDGLQFPIMLWRKTGELLDGRNRYAACEIAEIQPAIAYYEGDDPVGFVLSANIHRRHLTAAQRRDLIAELLKLNPEKSDRQIAAQTKTSPTTVGKVRKKAENSGDVSKLDTRTDTKGRRQPASKPAAANFAQAVVPLDERRAEMARLADEPKAPEKEAPVGGEPGAFDYEKLKKQIVDLTRALGAFVKAGPAPAQAEEIAKLMEPMVGSFEFQEAPYDELCKVVDKILERKRYIKEAKNPQKALDAVRKQKQKNEMIDDIAEAKREAREGGDAWGDVKDEWLANWLEDNWDDKREQDFLSDFKSDWKDRHGLEFPGSDFAGGQS